MAGNTIGRFFVCIAPTRPFFRLLSQVMQRNSGVTEAKFELIW